MTDAHASPPKIIVVACDKAGVHVLGEYPSLDAAGLDVSWEPHGIKEACDGRPLYWRASTHGARVQYCAFRVTESPHMLGKYYGWLYSTLAGEYRERQSRHDEPVTAMAEAMASYLPRAATVLDVGCGTGQLLAAYRRAGLSPCGVDLSDGMCAHAVANCPGDPVFRADFLENPVSQAQAVSAVALIHLFPSREEARLMGRLVSLVRPGGVLLISTTLAAAETEGWESKADYKIPLPRYRRQFTDDGLSRLCAAHGLTVVSEIRRSTDKNWKAVIARTGTGLRD